MLRELRPWLIWGLVGGAMLGLIGLAHEMRTSDLSVSKRSERLALCERALRQMNATNREHTEDVLRDLLGEIGDAR